MTDPEHPFDFDVSKMTPEEVIARLKARGIRVGEWVSNVGHVTEERRAPLRSLKAHATLLEEMGKLLKQQIDRDTSEVDDLSYQLRRLKHGGGR